MRKFLLFAIAVCIAVTCGAVSFNTVTVHLNDGSQVDITMTDGLSLSFDETNLVATGSGADVTVEKSKIVKLSHSQQSGIADITADGGFSHDGNALNFDNLPDGSTVAVYGINGVAVYSARVSGSHTLPLDGMAPGIYVVRVNNMSYKISVK